ncbi:hypothetical protein TNCV_3943491 [Trichonephila clavipes]|nr:hypothetical protein TNCV_3943491 [Trichonephila clavipes]
MCHSDVTWYQSLPTILLGLFTTFHEDFKATSAELMFGENLHLPGDFLHGSKLASPSSFVQQLRNTFADLCPAQSSHHTKQKSFIIHDLATYKSSTTSISSSTVSAAPHHSQQDTSEQSSKLQERFTEPLSQYVTHSGCAVHPSKRFHSDLAQPDFFLFRIKSMLKGKHHELVEAVQQAVTIPCLNWGGGDRWCRHLSSLRGNSHCHLYGDQGQRQAYF